MKDIKEKIKELKEMAETPTEKAITQTLDEIYDDLKNLKK